MKRLIVFLLIMCFFASSALADNEDYYPFNLADKNTYEEVVAEMSSLFGEGEEGALASYAITPEAKLLGIEIETIYILKSIPFNDDEKIKWMLEIDLNNNDNSAETIASIYDYLCSIYGEPLEIEPLIYDYDLDGEKHVDNLIKNKSELQQTIDRAKAGQYTRQNSDYTSDSFSYDVTWKNCSLNVYVSTYSSSISIKWIKNEDNSDQ